MNFEITDLNNGSHGIAQSVMAGLARVAVAEHPSEPTAADLENKAALADARKRLHAAGIPISGAVEIG